MNVSINVLCCISALVMRLASENELAFGHGTDRNEKVLEGDNLLCRDDIVANVEAFNLAFLEGVGELLDVVHDDQIVADVEVLECGVASTNHFAEFGRRLT